MFKKAILGIVAFFVVVIVIGALAGGDENKQSAEPTKVSGQAAAQPTTLPSKPAAQLSVATPEPKPTNRPAPTATPQATFTPVPTPTPFVLTGSGQQATTKFNLSAGLTIFEMTHDGQANFAIFLLNDEGKQIDLLVNEIGSFDGVKAIGIDRAGEYLANVTADGQWTVAIKQPKPAGGVTLPQSFSGTGKQVSPFFQGKGLHVVKMDHSGEGNFAIWLMDAKGKRVQLLVNEIGSFTGSKAIKLQDTVYILDITADGDWVITMD